VIMFNKFIMYLGYLSWKDVLVLVNVGGRSRDSLLQSIVCGTAVKVPYCKIL